MTDVCGRGADDKLDWTLSRQPTMMVIDDDGDECWSLHFDRSNKCDDWMEASIDECWLVHQNHTRSLRSCLCHTGLHSGWSWSVGGCQLDITNIQAKTFKQTFKHSNITKLQSTLCWSPGVRG
jgi:hypothetical protein